MLLHGEALSITITPGPHMGPTLAYIRDRAFTH